MWDMLSIKQNMNSEIIIKNIYIYIDIYIHIYIYIYIISLFFFPVLMQCSFSFVSLTARWLQQIIWYSSVSYLVG